MMFVMCFFLSEETWAMWNGRRFHCWFPSYWVLDSGFHSSIITFACFACTKTRLQISWAGNYKLETNLNNDRENKRNAARCTKDMPQRHQYALPKSPIVIEKIEQLFSDIAGHTQIQRSACLEKLCDVCVTPVLCAHGLTIITISSLKMPNFH